MYVGTIFQIAALLDFTNVHQQANKSKTLLPIPSIIFSELGTICFS